HARLSRAGVLRGARHLLGEGLLARLAPDRPARRLARLPQFAAAPLGLARPQAADLPPLDRLVLITPPSRPAATPSPCACRTSFERSGPFPRPPRRRSRRPLARPRHRPRQPRPPRPRGGAAAQTSGSVRGCRVLDQHLVVASADLDRLANGTLVARGGEHHALAWGKNRLEAHGRSGLTLREDGDNPKTAVLDDVVGDAGYCTE